MGNTQSSQENGNMTSNENKTSSKKRRGKRPKAVPHKTLDISAVKAKSPEIEQTLNTPPEEPPSAVSSPDGTNDPSQRSRSSGDDRSSRTKDAKHEQHPILDGSHVPQPMVIISRRSPSKRKPAIDASTMNVVPRASPPQTIGKRKRDAQDHFSLIRHGANRPKTTGFPSSGALTDDELKAINDTAEDFIQQQGITRDQLYGIIEENPNTDDLHKAFWTQIMNNFPNRMDEVGRLTSKQRQNIIKVVRRCMNKYIAYGNHWDPEMDQLLWDTVQRDMSRGGPKYTLYQETFNRYHEYIRDRYRWMEKSATGPWNAEEESKFVKILKQSVAKLRKDKAAVEGLNPSAEASNSEVGYDELFEYEDVINFKTVATQMSSRNQLQCRNKFKIMKEKRKREVRIEEAREIHDYHGNDLMELQTIDHCTKMKIGDLYSILLDVQSNLVQRGGSHETDIRWSEVHENATITTWTIQDRKFAFREVMSRLAGRKVKQRVDTLETLAAVIRYFEKKKQSKLDQFYDVEKHGELLKVGMDYKRPKSAAAAVEQASDSD